MPLPSAPAPKVSRRLSQFTQLPGNVVHVRVTVASDPQGKRVNVRVDTTERGKPEALFGTLRVGVVLWRAFVGPALRAHCESRGVRFQVREVEYATTGVRE